MILILPQTYNLILIPKQKELQRRQPINPIGMTTNLPRPNNRLYLDLQINIYIGIKTHNGLI